MLNRIFRRSILTDYISYKCSVAYVSFANLEELTQTRLLQLGYSPPIEQLPDQDIPFAEETLRGELLCHISDSPWPKPIHLGDLENWLKQQSSGQSDF